ncbi:hypothetical protein P3W85_08050 [Cupriavidus basilensis]|uniref:Uncharacterized protein n=1 Tax=Cupriavidus basilensis TaxID=68895 RepID=A0ABT6AJV9_9BURK|nr:hypothetical protein [Cupriavidus basilensis]MDF3832898.1 hypothetical protein [Cupriavidus basilensis]
MKEYSIPGSMAAPQALALASILAVTRREWQLAGAGRIGSNTVHHDGRKAGAPGSRPRQRRRDQLAQRAARAFEAQIMALRCRQAFVA